MQAIILIIHLVLALGIIGLVLLQRSEGGGLGIGGGGGGMGGFATARGTANFLTRATAICAGCFFLTSLLLGVLAGHGGREASLIEQLENQPAAESMPAPADIDAELPEITETPDEPQMPEAPVAE